MSRPLHGLALPLMALAALAWSDARAGAAGDRYAFLVGCGEYRKAEFRALPYTANDVLGLRDALVATGFQADHVVVLYDRTPKPVRYLPSRANVVQELDLFLAGMGPDDTVVVALSGHGLQFKGDPVSYFVPVDGKLADKNTLVALDGPGGLYDKLKACRAQRKLLIVNACRSDPTVSLDFAAGKVELTDEDAGDVPEGVAAIFSCAARQKSYYDPRRKRSLFFDHVIRAWKGEYAGGQAVTLERFFREVSEHTRLDAYHTLAVAQVPQVKREYQGEWVLTDKPAAPATPAATPVVPTVPVVTVARLSDELEAGRRLLRQGEPAQALVRLEKAGTTSPARSARGVARLRTGRYAEALADFRAASALDSTNREAALYLGWMHRYGYGVVPQDAAEALRWFRKAADLGEPEAMAMAGLMLAAGHGAPRDAAAAARLYRQAADLGEPLAMYGLGLAYQYGNGVTRDDAEGQRWYARAAAALPATGERAIALEVLGSLYRFGRGVRADAAEAVRWYRKAAALGDLQAMTKLASAFHHGAGAGVAKDEAEALRWYRQAAILGDGTAMNALGLMYRDGSGVAKDAAEAVRWFRKAAELGDRHAMYHLARLHAGGAGVPADPVEVARWYRRAADLGYAPALVALGRAYETAAGVPRDLAEALRCYRKAAELGSTVAMVHVGRMYEHGLGVAVQREQAAQWYRRAADKGSKAGQDGLQRLSRLAAG